MTAAEEQLDRRVVIGPRTLQIESKIPVIVKRIKDDKFHLENVTYGDKEVSLGDKVEVDVKLPDNIYRTYFKANYMYKINDNIVQVNEFEDNMSSTYVLPLLGIKQTQLLLKSNFINCYLQHHVQKSPLGEVVYLIYRYLPITYYAKFTNAIKQKENCLMYLKDKDKRFYCFIFEVEKKFQKDIRLLLDGKFSKISNDAKKKILNFWNQTNPDDPLNQILYKGELRRSELEESLGVTLPVDTELSTQPHIINETWNYSK